MKSNYTFSKWVAALLFVVTLIINYLVSAFRINGTTTGEVSNDFPNLFAPIALTFAIWGLIYLSLGLYTIRQFGVWAGKKSKTTDKVITKITPLYIATSLVNTAWIFAWQYKVIWLSLLLIVALLILLIWINMVLDTEKLEGKDYWLIKFPFSIYFGWLTVATIANAVVWLVSIGWDGLAISEQFWTVAIMVIGALIGIITSLRFRSAAYILVFAWAYFGILLKHISPSYFNNTYPQIVICATLLIAVFVFTAALVNGKLLGTKRR